MYASVHQLLLAPLNVSPIFDGQDTGPLVSVTDNATALIILTGCADGPVRLTTELLAEPPSATDTWEVQESVSITISEPLHLSSPTWTEMHEPVLVPHSPGTHRVRVSARGRRHHYDQSVTEVSEHYLIQAWPQSQPEPRQTHGDDDAEAGR